MLILKKLNKVIGLWNIGQGQIWLAASKSSYQYVNKYLRLCTMIEALKVVWTKDTDAPYGHGRHLGKWTKPFEYIFFLLIPEG